MLQMSLTACKVQERDITVFRLLCGGCVNPAPRIVKRLHYLSAVDFLGKVGSCLQVKCGGTSRNLESTRGR